MRTFVDDDGIKWLQLKKLPKSHFDLLKKFKLPTLARYRPIALKQTARRPIRIPLNPRKRMLRQLYKHRVERDSNPSPKKRNHTVLHDPRYYWLDIN